MERVTEKNDGVDRKAFSVTDFAQADSDDSAYWKSRTPAERMEALVVIRRVIYGEAAVTGRLQRVLEIIERQPD
ncbi:MAG: hypothetical protein ACKOS8_11795 [Gemmataceae bacterium]